MWSFQATPVGIVAGAAFTSMLLVAAAGDIRSRRIPNRLILTLAACGLIYSVAAGSLAGGIPRAIGGIVVGLACWLPFYAMGWLAAGDVKLFAAAGAWLGPLGAVEGAFIGACAGGLLALAWMIRVGGVRSTGQVLGMAAGSPSLLSGKGRDGRQNGLPYGVAIAFGAICVGWMPGLLFS